ncbi:MAG: DUF4139 domain-containing protein [Phycisphaerae bacterium]|nr:DUF4139 domain-containing protein [Phycisphaerae bacterium]
MRRAVSPVLFAGLFIATSASGQEVPLKRVTIFSSGVAFYERAGHVDGTATMELPFKTAQINDILKSMVLQDMGGGKIRPVVYAPKDPIEKTLRSFGIDLTQDRTLGEFLGDLRGTPVEITVRGDSKPIEGSVLSVERQIVIMEDKEVPHDVLNVACAEGIRAFRLTELSGVRLADPKLNGELFKALGVLAGSHDADKKPVILEFAGEGKREVRVSYILEAPIWKTSYRLILDGEKPFLQGWATVDNTTDEDWIGVDLTLVSGRPISFVQDLYQPLYIPRPVVQPEIYASLGPQQYEGAMFDSDGDGILADAADAVEREMPSRMKTARRAAPADNRGGFGAGFGGAAPAASPAPVASLDYVTMESSVESIAAAAEAGEMFTYAIQTPVTLPRQKSAMMPIVNQSVAGEKYSIYSQSVHAKHPLNGLRLENTTDLNLMQGPITVFEDGTYAGDAQLPDVTPGEKRLISYSLDLKREVERVSKAEPEVLTSVRIAKGTLIATRKYVEEYTFNVKNKDDAVRAVLLEHPFRADWTLVTPKDPFERTPQVYRFKVDAKPNETTSLTVREERQGDQYIALSSSGLDTIEFYIRAKVVSPKVREALEKVAQMRNELGNTQARKNQQTQRVAQITADQGRVRENLKTVREGTELHERYLKKLTEQENELDEANRLIAQYTQQEQQQKEALDQYLLNLNIE